MQWIELVQRLHSESLRSTAAPTAFVGVDARNLRLFNWVADAWRDIQTERSDWKWMLATLDEPLTISLGTYTSTDLNATRFARWRREDSRYGVYAYQTGSPNSLWDLEYVPLDVFRRDYVYIDHGSSTPLVWTIDETQQLLLAPVPAIACNLRIDYLKAPTELTADADEPDLPVEYKLLPMWRALKAVALADAAPEVLTRAEREYDSLYDKMLRDQAARLPYV